MNKENNRSAAGLRRSAIAERIRLRKEWSALKEIDESPASSATKTVTNILKKKHQNIRKPADPSKNTPKVPIVSSDALRGVVALVEVDNESRALALRAALTALGATVVPTWSPLVSHLIWAEGGSHAARRKARALASRLVSPLWVEACAASNRRLPERVFPAAARASDLPSPGTLTRMLKKAEMENITLNLLDDSDENDQKATRLRISSETEHDTTGDTTVDTSVNTTVDKSVDSSVDKSRDTTVRSKDSSQEIEGGTPKPLVVRPSVAPRKAGTNGRELVRAERTARRLLAACSPAAAAPAIKHTLPSRPRQHIMRIVLTGMSREERAGVSCAVRALGGARLQPRVGARTTHVVLGSCGDPPPGGPPSAAATTDALPLNTTASQPLTALPQKARTLSALAGAARGARVLTSRWVEDSRAAGRWLHHAGYEVPHLKKISQKARVERTALRRERSEYAYDVFYGMRVCLKPDAEQRDAALQLLTLCGASVQHGGQHGGAATADCDVTVGAAVGEVGSKWVFDSVAAARMRTTRRYVNRNPPELVWS